MVPRVLGAPARGDSFFDREEIFKNISTRLNQGSILLVAPRRFGKTSLMLKAVNELKSEGKIGLFLDVEWVSKPADFIIEVISKLEENTPEKFSKWVKKLPSMVNSIKDGVDSLEIHGFRLKLREELKERWVEKGRELFKALKNLDTEVVLFVDEFPLMIHNMIEKGKIDFTTIRNFVYWLRSMRIDIGVKMVFGGSIGIDYVLKKMDAGTSINDLERIKVGAFDYDTANKFIVSLFNSEDINIDDETVKRILDLLGAPIPYFIQIIVSELINECRLGKSMSPDVVEAVYSKNMLGVQCRSYFEHYFDRLKLYYDPEDAKISKALLKDLAIKRKMSKKELFQIFSSLTKDPDRERFYYLISDLENDFYIIYNQDIGAYVFAAKVLQDLWLRRYEVLQ